MKIVHIVPGSGDSFYCQNCMRDNSLVKELRKRGHEVAIVPMYLPVNIDEPEKNYFGDTPVFYGAINTYLKQVMPLYRKAPLWLERLMDSKILLNMAAHKAGSTNAAGMEDMTISMLQGELGNQATELQHLINWLKNHEKPDVVHLSNALLLGLASKIKRDLNIPVFCSLQDEDQWINPMAPQFQQRVWDLMAEKGRDVAAFTAVSHYWAAEMQKKMQIPADKLHTIYIGIPIADFTPNPLPFNPPVIGFLSRLCKAQGLDLLTDACLLLKKDHSFQDIKLQLMGGYTANNEKFVKQQQHKFIAAGFGNDITIYTGFDHEQRRKFLQSLTILSVPVLNGEAFGTYLIEAFAAGVPVVQPNIGAFPELVASTNGGLIYSDKTPAGLALALKKVLSDHNYAATLGEQGARNVSALFNIEKMALAMEQVYKKFVT